MARPKLTTEIMSLRFEIADRLVTVRIALFPGQDGHRKMAASLGIAYGTWRGYYARAQTIDHVVLLRLLTAHRVSPQYLLSGEGPMFLAAEPKPKLMTGAVAGR